MNSLTEKKVINQIRVSLPIVTRTCYSDYCHFILLIISLQLLGCAILGIGIWLHIAKGSYAEIAPSFKFLSATALCIAAGAIVLIVGFFGCCGAIMENQCMLLTVRNVSFVCHHLYRTSPSLRLFLARQLILLPFILLSQCVQCANRFSLSDLLRNPAFSQMLTAKHLSLRSSFLLVFKMETKCASRLSIQSEKSTRGKNRSPGDVLLLQQPGWKLLFTAICVKAPAKQIPFWCTNSH